jgi:hypothetical protein
VRVRVRVRGRVRGRVRLGAHRGLEECAAAAAEEGVAREGDGGDAGLGARGHLEEGW